MARLNNLFASLLLFGLCLNAVLYLFAAFQVNTASSALPFPDFSNWTTWFNFSGWNLLFTAGVTAAIGIVTVLLRNQTFAIYSMLVAAISMVIGPIQQFILIIPNSVASWFPAATNPNPLAFPVNPLVVFIDAIFAFAAFWFVFGLVIQRDP